MVPAPDVPLDKPGPVNADSKGCGAVMRSAPFGLLPGGPATIFERAARAGMLTHGHPTGYLAAGAFAAIVRLLLDGVPLCEAVRQTLDLLSSYSTSRNGRRPQRARAAADRGEPSAETVEHVGAGWVAEEVLAVAIYCTLVRGEADQIRDTLVLAVNHSGDSDSTGAICGNLLGITHGLTHLPSARLTVFRFRATARSH